MERMFRVMGMKICPQRGQWQFQPIDSEAVLSGSPPETFSGGHQGHMPAVQHTLKEVSQKARGTQRVPLVFCFFLLNLTNDFVDLESAARRAADRNVCLRSLRRRQTCAPVRSEAEIVGLFDLLAGQGVVGSMSTPV